MLLTGVEFLDCKHGSGDVYIGVVLLVIDD